jgi:hypothetical protein
VYVVVARLVGTECAAYVSLLPAAPPKVWAQSLHRKRLASEVGGREVEAEEGGTWGRVEESLIRASGIGLGASGAGLVQLRHREDLVVR